MIRLIIATFHEFCKIQDPEKKWKRGITAALRTRQKNLSINQQLLLEKEFSLHPEIRLAYNFKEELCSLLCINEQNKASCAALISKLKEMVWIMLNKSPKIFEKLGRTISQWFEPIIRMW